MTSFANRTAKTLLWTAAAAVATAALSPKAYAEYRCATPRQLTSAETRACELARQDSPDALIHFTRSTKGVYDLYLPDYFSEADQKRWEHGKREKASDARTGAKATLDSKDTPKAAVQ